MTTETKARVPRASLSPDAIKLIVKVLKNALDELNDAEADVRNLMDLGATHVKVSHIAICTIQAVIDACTEEPKP